ncbi:hypothetical protein ABD05_29585 [Burkholderia pyrrocinia]|nr:hypothetical protein ABD05_29585 [Burkholderia pyrrocinia]
MPLRGRVFGPGRESHSARVARRIVFKKTVHRHQRLFVEHAEHAFQLQLQLQRIEIAVEQLLPVARDVAPQVQQPTWRIRDAGGDLLLSGKTNVSAKVKSVWEPVFTVGASYQITRRFWITGMVTYIPLRTKITLDISQPNRTLASNTFDISANPVLASVLLAFRF